MKLTDSIDAITHRLTRARAFHASQPARLNCLFIFGIAG